MCGTFENGDQKEKEKERSELNNYILEPFPKHKFEPLGWNDVLATMTICVNEVVPTLFCDEDGFDVIPIQMVNVLETQEECNPKQESNEDPPLEKEINHINIDNQVSTFDLSSGHETQGTNYYDASDELEDWDLQENQNKHANPMIFKTREGKAIELPNYPHPKHGAIKNLRKKKPKGLDQKPRPAPSIRGK